MDVSQAMQYCRFSKRYQGYRELRECVNIALREEERLLYIGGIYYEVGRKFHVSASGVERNIRTLVNSVWENGGRDSLENICGGKLYERPSASEVIEILACYVKESERTEKIREE